MPQAGHYLDSLDGGVLIFGMMQGNVLGCSRFCKFILSSDA